MPDWQPPKTDAELLDRVAKALDAPEAAKPDPVEAFAGTAFTNFNSGPRKFQSYAHFPGTGPAGETCNSCQHVRMRQAGAKKLAICSEFKRLKPGVAASAIDHRAAACRYWQVRAGKIRAE